MQPHQRLEVEWARFNGLDPAGMVACASGTAALHLAWEALQLPPGSEVVCPDFTMIACARAVSLAGHTPVFVDCGIDLNIDVSLIADAYRQCCPEAILAVHTYGRRADMDTVHCLTYQGEAAPPVQVVEDLAEAHGIHPHPDTDAACWSFYANKIVGGQEGGAVWFRDPTHAALARRLRCLGFDDAHTFSHCPRGMNYRLANALAAPILDSLARYPENAAERRRIEGWYDDACPPEWRMPPRDCPWVYDLQLRSVLRGRDDVDIAGVVRGLRAAGVQARHAFRPMHQQEEYAGCRLVTAGRSVAAEAYASVLYLPIQPFKTTREQVGRSLHLLAELVSA